MQLSYWHGSSLVCRHFFPHDPRLRYLFLVPLTRLPTHLFIMCSRTVWWLPRCQNSWNEWSTPSSWDQLTPFARIYTDWFIVICDRKTRISALCMNNACTYRPCKPLEEGWAYYALLQIVGVNLIFWLTREMKSNHEPNWNFLSIRSLSTIYHFDYYAQMSDVRCQLHSVPMGSPVCKGHKTYSVLLVILWMTGRLTAAINQVGQQHGSRKISNIYLHHASKFVTLRRWSS